MQPGHGSVGEIGLGGAIGTGIFLAGGLAVADPGPAVIVRYAIAGFVALVMVFSLAETAVVHSTPGWFDVYAEMHLNPWAPWLVIISVAYFAWRARSQSSSLAS